MTPTTTRMSPQRPQYVSDTSDQKEEACPESSSSSSSPMWTDFTATWNAFGSTASNWWESAASTWQPALREAEEEDFPSAPGSPASFYSTTSREHQQQQKHQQQHQQQQAEAAESPHTYLARIKQNANRRHPYHNNNSSNQQHEQRSQMMRMNKELFKMSSHTMTSDSSSASSGELYEDEASTIWDAQHGSRLEVMQNHHHHSTHPEEQGEEVGYNDTPFHDDNNNGKSGYCCCCCFCCPSSSSSFAKKSLKYKFGILLLVLALLACAAVVALASIDISHKRSEVEEQQTDNANNNIMNQEDTNSEPPTSYPLATPDPTSSSPTTSAPTVTTMAPTEEPLITYIPGKLTTRENGLLLSEGLKSRIIAQSGQAVALTGLPPVQTTTSSQVQQEPLQYYKSLEAFHPKPDGAAIFEWEETGGWVYVSNSEVKEVGQGGVGAIYFDQNGNVMDYQRLLDGTTMNCSGGPTPWGTWVTCEEIDGGKAYQVDPFGIRPPQPLSTLDTGFFESFAHDVRDPQAPAFFVTEDKERGPLRKIVPSNPDWEDPWEILHGLGSLEYLVLEPDPLDDTNSSGSYYWTTEKEVAKINSQQYYKQSEGIDVHNDQLFFVSKSQKELFILNLDDMTYEVHSTVSGVFDGHPDQMKRLIHNGLLYFCEEGGKENGIHARDENGWFFSVLESESLNDETTGLAFSPNGKHMYVSFQHNGLIFDIYREDGLPFHGRTLNVKYHEIVKR